MDRITGRLLNPRKILAAALVLVILFIWGLIFISNDKAQGRQSHHRHYIEKVVLEDGKYVCFVYNRIEAGISCLEADS
jgi:hypothetical protein